ncbi:MAG: nitronate monooxygenase [Spirochaetales bacterium]|nr:MAG: nitronate monooxygenase [Spirochaetales bacterium]
MSNFPALRIGELIARVPIVQGGMGVGISLSRLASAVANEGGVGVISAAMIGAAEPDIGSNPLEANIRALKREIHKAKETIKDGLLGVNVMMALTNFADMVRTSVEEKVDIIFAGAGLPMDLPKYLVDGAKTKLVPIVSSARATTIIIKRWLSNFNYLPDAIVVEGPKAGGHLGFKPEQIDAPEHQLQVIVPEVIAAVRPFELESGRKIPVIAGGGIYTGEDIAEFLEMGAAGVQMGTRFVATDECDADIAFKQAYIDSCKDDITIIQSPVGLPGRAIRDDFLRQVEEGKKHPINCPFHCLITCDPENSPYCIAAALVQAMKGRLNNGFAFCGSNAWRVNAIVPVRELMRSLKEGFEKAVGKFKPA